MDFFDERILTMLKDGKPRGFTALLNEVGFSHNTLQQHLERLMTKGLVIREKVVANGFGRPKFAPKSENKNYNHFTPIKGTSQRAQPNCFEQTFIIIIP